METALYTIKHRLNMEMLVEQSTMSTAMKRRFRIFKFLACWFAATTVWSIYDKDVFGVCLCAFLSILMLLYPLRVKKCLRKFYAKDENILKDRTLYLYEDHFELETVVSLSKVGYDKIKKFVETDLGVYLYFGGISALCVPKEAFAQEALEFLRSKSVKGNCADKS